MSGGGRLGRHREGKEVADEDIHFLVTPTQKRIYEGWGKGKNRILRDFISMRAESIDDLDRRENELIREKEEIEQELERVRRSKEDYAGPLQDKASVIAGKYIEDGVFALPEDTQRARVDGWCGQDDTLAAMVWDIIRERGGDEWGG